MGYVVGCDVGQSIDPTALGVLEVTTWKDQLMENPGQPSPIDMSRYPKTGGGLPVVGMFEARGVGPRVPIAGHAPLR